MANNDWKVFYTSPHGDVEWVTGRQKMMQCVLRNGRYYWEEVPEETPEQIAQRKADEARRREELRAWIEYDMSDD